jgi:cytoplasmic iron level regulating protein YaaA (DUF328/UPF0246 family)
MKKIVLISCVSKKCKSKAPAKDLYKSTLFKLNLQYAQSLSPDEIYILSAKYGLLGLYEEIEPYDVTLNKMDRAARQNWSRKVLKQLEEHCNLQNDHFIILAGEKYRQFLIHHLNSYEIPLKGLTIGKQLQYLKRQVSNE